jgi:hypothetical protein
MTTLAALALLACSGDEPAPPPVPAPAPVEAPAPKQRTEGPLPSIVVTQAWFKNNKPQPAKMVVYAMDGDEWYDETVLDKDSNVFHKGMAWRDGILTIGAEDAIIKHWKKVDGEWKGTEIWKQSWGGKFDRVRDIELADLDGDGKEEMAVATHDMGVVAVGDENDDGTWTFAEFDKTADIFVHEVEVGDVDGDGKKEFYVTPSERNKSSGVSQPGGVARYDFRDGTYVKTQVVWWDESHAKEILVTDTDGDGTDELYVVKEGHVVKENGKKVLKDPVTIVRMSPEGPKAKKWTETPVATLAGDPQTRFVVPGDVDGDGQIEIVAAGMDTGLHVLQPNGDGTFTAELIDKNSGGFEHATHVADLDGDGKLEIYVASDKQRQLRRYTWADGKWNREKIADFPKSHITWNVQDGVF